MQQKNKTQCNGQSPAPHTPLLRMALCAALAVAAAAGPGVAAAGPSTPALTCNHQNCPGGDIAWANPLPSTQGWTLTNCSAKCDATAGCVGWVYQGSSVKYAIWRCLTLRVPSVRLLGMFCQMAR